MTSDSKQYQSIIPVFLCSLLGSFCVFKGIDNISLDSCWQLALQSSFNASLIYIINCSSIAFFKLDKEKENNDKEH